jgi:biopolymer transport protein ExbD/biopolymer transport protein TolR
MAFTTPQGNTQTVLAEINMIPFIDVMLVLLIIFMITAPVIQSGIEVKVPKTVTVREMTEERVIVTIDSDGTVYLQNKPVHADELADKILEQNPGSARQSVYFSVDETVPWKTGIAVLDILKLGGIEDISIVTQPMESPKAMRSAPAVRK